MSEEMIKDVVVNEVTETAAAPEVASVETAPVEPVVAPTSAVSEFGADQAVIDKLTEFGADPTVIEKIVSGLGVKTADDLKYLNENEFTGAGMKLISARKLVESIKEAQKPAANAEIGTSVITNQYSKLLPAIPDDGSWLEALKTGGILNVNEASLIGAVRAALANRVGYYEIPGKIVKAMEVYARETRTQVGPDYFKMRKLLTRRSHGDLFAAIDGFSGSDLAEKDKKDFLKNIEGLWPALEASFRILKNWIDDYNSTCGPTMLLAVASGSPAIFTAPDMNALHKSGEAVNNVINEAFACFGLLASNALAFEAREIKKVIEDPRLPSLIGAGNREQMFSKLGINVSSDYILLEDSLTQYTLGICNCARVTADTAVKYNIALYQVGQSIDWAKLTGRSVDSVTLLTGKKLQRETL